MQEFTKSFSGLRREITGALANRPFPYRASEGFCGPGGMSLGLNQAGFEISAAFDIDPPAVATHNRNLGGGAFVADATVGEVLRGLAEHPEDYSEHPDFANHQRARVTELSTQRFSHVPQGGGWRDIPLALRLPCHRRVDTDKGGWPDVFGRLEWAGLCPTITGGR